MATYGEPPGTSPSDLRAVAVSSSSIRLTWTAINRNSWHSNLIGYHLGFRQDKYDVEYKRKKEIIQQDKENCFKRN